MFRLFLAFMIAGLLFGCGQGASAVDENKFRVAVERGVVDAEKAFKQWETTTVHGDGLIVWSGSTSQVLFVSLSVSHPAAYRWSVWARSKGGLVYRKDFFLDSRLVMTPLDGPPALSSVEEMLGTLSPADRLAAAKKLGLSIKDS